MEGKGLKGALKLHPILQPSNIGLIRRPIEIRGVPSTEMVLVAG